MDNQRGYLMEKKKFGSDDDASVIDFDLLFKKVGRIYGRAGKVVGKLIDEVSSDPGKTFEGVIKTVGTFYGQVMSALKSVLDGFETGEKGKKPKPSTHRPSGSSPSQQKILTPSKPLENKVLKKPMPVTRSAPVSKSTAYNRMQLNEKTKQELLAILSKLGVVNLNASHHKDHLINRIIGEQKKRERSVR